MSWLSDVFSGDKPVDPGKKGVKREHAKSNRVAKKDGVVDQVVAKEAWDETQDLIETNNALHRKQQALKDRQNGRR